MHVSFTDIHFIVLHTKHTQVAIIQTHQVWAPTSQHMNNFDLGVSLNSRRALQKALKLSPGERSHFWLKTLDASLAERNSFAPVPS